MKDLIEALTIFLKYSNERRPTHCEHDVLQISGIEKGVVSAKDAERLEQLGFHWSDPYSCWLSYKFGSA